MKVLVIGGGGREHALAWRLRQSEGVSQVFVAPGNAGTARDPQLTNLDITDKSALRTWAQTNGIALTVVGPEAPLAAGVVDEFRAHGLAIFGPTKAAAQLESSKAFSKAFMERHGIPTASYQTFTDAAKAHAYVDAQGAPIVVKADGLAAGKGVVVAMTLDEAHAAIDFMLLDNALGVAHNEGGARVVIEEFLQGEEASFIVLCDGEHALALATSQDHKRLLDAGGHPRRAPACHGRGDPADPARNEGRWHPLHRLSLCRTDDHPRRAGEDAGVQLPHGGPRDAAHHDATAQQPGPGAAGRHAR